MMKLNYRSLKLTTVVNCIRSRVFLLSSVGFAIFFWLLEAVLHAWVFQFHDYSLKHELFPYDKHELWMRIIISAFFIIFGIVSQYFYNHLKSAHDSLQFEKTLLELSNKELTDAVMKIQILEKLLPICAKCKKIRSSEGDWIHLEKYMGDYAGVNFTHGICRDCGEEFRKDFGSGKVF